jgi:hypothetical protein
VLAVIPTTAAAAGRHGTPSIHVAFLRTAMTGEIRQLGTKRILVGTIGCSIPAKIAVSADRFVIGDPVRITCVNGILRTVTYSPAADPGATYSTHPNSPPTVATVTSPGVPFTPSTAKSAFYSFHTLSTSSSVSPTQTATGTISALSPDGITVGDLTCSLGEAYALISAVAKIGDNATVTCDAASGRLVTAVGSR